MDKLALLVQAVVFAEMAVAYYAAEIDKSGDNCIDKFSSGMYYAEAEFKVAVDLFVEATADGSVAAEAEEMLVVQEADRVDPDMDKFALLVKAVELARKAVGYYTAEMVKSGNGCNDSISEDLQGGASEFSLAVDLLILATRNGAVAFETERMLARRC